MSKIVRFLSGLDTDNQARHIADILAFDDESLEFQHDYIQWIFPLTEPSGTNFDAPVLTEEDIVSIRNSKNAQLNFAILADRMLKFFQKSEDFYRFKNHNHLRVTRIIKSLRLLCSDTAANDFKEKIFAFVENSNKEINQRSIECWWLA